MSENQEKTKQNIVTFRDDDKNTQLHYAAAAGDEESVVRELASGQKVDTENYLGWTPLMMAARNDQGTIVKLLIQEYRADATKRNKFGISVFLISITTGKFEIVSFLLEHLLCGGISRQSIQKIFSPISIAILFNHMEITKYLVSKSFDINCSMAVTGITPLMIAAAMEFKEIYSFLLQNGADANQRNVVGYTAEIQTKMRKPKRKEKYCSPQLPMIIVSPQPFMQFPNPPPPMYQQRKSSNTISPNYIPPNVTPITPVGFCPQYFFPPDFSPNHPFVAVSPMVPGNYNPHEIMNMRMFLSPVNQQNYPTSPCA